MPSKRATRCFPAPSAITTHSSAVPSSDTSLARKTSRTKAPIRRFRRPSLLHASLSSSSAPSPAADSGRHIDAGPGLTPHQTRPTPAEICHLFCAFPSRRLSEEILILSPRHHPPHVDASDLQRQNPMDTRVVIPALVIIVV